MSTSLIRYLSVAEAARRLGVSPSTVWRWIDARALPAERVGARRIRIREDDLQRVVAPARESAEEHPVESQIRSPEAVSPEEIARRRKLYARVLELRQELSGSPMTATEALEEVDRERRERHESWVGIRR
jgi:excisionase family DNA binding protein